MNARRFNWPLWVGFLITLFAAFSFITIFVWFPVTRDFPWVNLLLFAIGAVLLFVGIRRAFARDRAHPIRSKIIASVIGTLSVAMIGLFLFAFFVMARWLPASGNAPHVGQKVPDFALSDTNGKQVSLAELLSTPIQGKAPKGVLLVFYRGYW